MNRHLRQVATYWSQTGKDRYGKATFAAPVSVPVRWEDKQQRAVDTKGVEFLSRSTVYVDRDMELGDYIILGTFHSSPPVGASQIRSFGSTPNLQNTQSIHKVLL